MVVTEKLAEAGVEKHIVEDVQGLINRVTFQTLKPFIERFAEPEHMEFYMAYIKMSMGMMTHSEWMREAVALGYNVHGGDNEGGPGGAEVPDLTHFMPEIADTFEGYLRDKLP